MFSNPTRAAVSHKIAKWTALSFPHSVIQHPPLASSNKQQASNKQAQQVNKQVNKLNKQANRSLSLPMGNEHSTAAHGGKCDGVPFVTWRPASGALSPRATSDRLSVSSDRSARSSGSGGLQHSPASPATTTTPVGSQQQRTNTPAASSYHFAEPSSFKYDKVARVVTAPAVFTKPAKADSVIVNRAELLGAIAIVERGGRVHFPDIVRRVLAAGAVGIVFIERVDNKTEMQSLFDGFHSSGRQSVPVPIVLLSKFHADALVAEQPARLTIEILSGDQAIRHMVADDTYFAVATAARAGEVELLKHLLYSDTSGSVLEVHVCAVDFYVFIVIIIGNIEASE